MESEADAAGGGVNEGDAGAAIAGFEGACLSGAGGAFAGFSFGRVRMTTVLRVAARAISRTARNLVIQRVAGSESFSLRKEKSQQIDCGDSVKLLRHQEVPSSI
jgi:hypothetical protein